MNAQLVYLIVLLAALIAMNWRFLGLDKLFGRERRPCRWRADPSMQGGRFGRYLCETCDAEAFTSNGRAPRECRRRGTY